MQSGQRILRFHSIVMTACPRPLSSVQASLSQRPRRTASTKRPVVRDAPSEEESEEAIEEEEEDEDFTI